MAKLFRYCVRRARAEQYLQQDSFIVTDFSCCEHGLTCFEGKRLRQKLSLTIHSLISSEAAVAAMGTTDWIGSYFSVLHVYLAGAWLITFMSKTRIRVRQFASTGRSMVNVSFLSAFVSHIELASGPVPFFDTAKLPFIRVCLVALPMIAASGLL